MPFEYCHNDYKKAIDSNDLSSLIRVSFDIETIRKEKIPCKFSYDKVIERVKSIKDKLIKEYDIKKLYLFGSFAKGKNTEKSDIDFLVAFNDDLINKERKDRIKVLIEYFKN